MRELSVAEQRYKAEGAVVDVPAVMIRREGVHAGVRRSPVNLKRRLAGLLT